MKTRVKSALSIFLSTTVFIAAGSISACAQLSSRNSADKKAPLSTASATHKIALAEPVPAEPIGKLKDGILLVYPRGENNNKIDCASTFLVGTLKDGRSLTCNGQAVTVSADGYFAHVVKLNYGTNDFTLAIPGKESQAMKISVERPAPPAPLSESTFNILPESLEPKVNIGVATGDLLQFAARATPGCQMSVLFGSHAIAMRPAVSRQGKNPSVNLGLDTAFGVTFQRSPAALKDLYLGFYKVQAADDWDKVAPTFVLKSGQKQIKAKAKGTLSTLKQPQVMQTAHANCIVRLGPGAARTTPLPENVRMLADGFKGEWWRFELASGKHCWINKEDLSSDDESNALPQSRVSTVNMGTDDYGATISIPLTQRLPYQIEQDLRGKKLLLHIFGATADTDFVTSDLGKPADSAVAKLIDYLSFKQKGDNHYELNVQLLNNHQWGFWADYKDNTLVLHVKNAPAIDVSSGSLKGATICVDPGHGGKEIGSIGCSGVKEAAVNFQIADKLRQSLEEMGARVVMTRKGDDFVSLQDRVDLAIASRSDMLISVHNNALPDGRDPWTEHGTSDYWYHPQSVEFARLAQKQMVQATGFKDFGSRFQNLALCRPSQMPAALMEIGFMINPDELSKLLDPDFQANIARSIANSTKKYLFDKVREQERLETSRSAEGGQ